jgi:hypothetical protein
MDRFNELLEKRKNLTATAFEEEELIEMSKKMTDEQLKDVDKELLIYSNHKRMDHMLELLDKMNDILNSK